MLITLFLYFIPSLPLSHPSVPSHETFCPLVLSYHLFSSSHTLASLILQYFNGTQEAWQRNLCFSSRSIIFDLHLLWDLRGWLTDCARVQIWSFAHIPVQWFSLFSTLILPSLQVSVSLQNQNSKTSAFWTFFQRQDLCFENVEADYPTSSKYTGWLTTSPLVPPICLLTAWKTSMFKNIQWTDSQVFTQTSPTYILLPIAVFGREEIFALGHSVHWS